MDNPQAASVELGRPKALYCARCNEQFEPREPMASTGAGRFWHLQCFVCSHCFRPFDPDSLEYYEREGRMYCERDFCTLFAASCARCHERIVGVSVRALATSWHPECLRCEQCERPLHQQRQLVGRLGGRVLCADCYAAQKLAARNRLSCAKCKRPLEPHERPLRLRDGQAYHAHHFHCDACGIELRPDARQLDGELYCLRCHDKKGVAVCGACRRPIEGRLVSALGKQWHVEHFACATCERPFNGGRHFEANGLAYCERDFHAQFGRKCCACSELITRAEAVSALGRFYCPAHFACALCERPLLANRAKFYDVSGLPSCKSCYLRLAPKVRLECARRPRLERKHKLAS